MTEQILNELKEFISDEYYNLFMLIHHGFSLDEIQKETKIKRKDILLKLIDLGRELNKFSLFNYKVIPNRFNEDYLQGFKDCYDQFQRECNNVKTT